MKQFKISAKNLAQLNMPNTCLRCFSNLLQLRHKTPYSIFPSIFSVFDSQQKHLVESTLEETGKFPDWLGEMSAAIGLADVPARMEQIDSRQNIVLVGVPDHVLEWSDKTVSPIDYKTSRYTKGQDSLKPLYVAQLDAYSHLLASQCSLESDRGALVYFEPKGPESMALTDDGYVQPWKVSVHPVEVSGELTDELLGKAREIYEQTIPPDGRAECIDCELFEKVLSLAQKQSVNTRDSLLRLMNHRERTEYLARAEFRRNTAHLDSPASSALPSEKSSLLMAWDWEE
jgi:hypothetical protein